MCVALALVAARSAWTAEQETARQFRVRPYLLNPAPDAMTVRWFSEQGSAGTVECNGATFTSEPMLARELDYQDAEPIETETARAWPGECWDRFWRSRRDQGVAGWGARGGIAGRHGSGMGRGGAGALVGAP